ncbi:hypothetical protein [Micromonospora mirobrigensis]|uniref:Uncharacterized protein n=1 Tax=Micromonospora mirobrigensis TaxID=262898 RepID=A0A1C4WZM4_9ACTN|nr:hypothetical protein [Micromonospora mirobrigensis]SCF01663.1 hypothetical protein GA0070564_102615 [Micromonospora mirobrigensis]
MKIAPASPAPAEGPQGYPLRRLDTLAELTRGGSPVVDDADGQAGVQGSI